MASGFLPLHFIAEPHLLELSADVLEERIIVDQQHLATLEQRKCHEEALINEEIRRLQARRTEMFARIDTETIIVKKRQQSSLRALAHGKFKLTGLANLPWEFLVSFFHPSTLLLDLSLTNTFMRAMIANPASGEPLCHPISFKYDCARSVSSSIERFRESYTKKIKSTSLFEKQLGTAAYLIDKFGLCGGEKREMARNITEPPSCLSLRVENIKLRDQNRVDIFCLDGKYERAQTVEPEVFRNLKGFLQNHRFGQSSVKEAYESVFDRITPNHLTKYLKSFQEGFSAKALRIHNASFSFQLELDKVCAKLHGGIVNRQDEETIFEAYRSNNIYVTRTPHSRHANETSDKTSKDVNYVDPRILVAFTKRCSLHSDSHILSCLAGTCSWAQSVSADWRF